MRQRDRIQKGYVWTENGNVYIRYYEYGTDNKRSHPTKILGTVEQLPNPTKIEKARAAFMAEINENAVVTYWGTLCDRFIQYGIRAPQTSDSYISHRSKANKLRNATYKGRRGEEVPFAKERLDHLCTPAGLAKLEDWLNQTVMAATYRTQVKNIMRQIFRYGQKQGYLNAAHNPADLIDVNNMPYNTNGKRVRELITLDQYDALMGDAELPRFAKVVLAVLYHSGMRGCEALGLSWEHGKPGDPDYREADISFSTTPPKIWVRRSWQKIRELDREEQRAKKPMPNKREFLNRAKTADSKRTVPLVDELAEILIHWKSTEPIINDWVFGSSDKRSKGRPYHPTTVRRQIKLAARRHGFGLDIGFGLHNNRHSYSDDVIDANATMDERLDYFGQTNPKTAKVYEGKDNARKLVALANRVVSIRAAKRASRVLASTEPVASAK